MCTQNNTKRCAFKQTGCALGLMWTWARNFETRIYLKIQNIEKYIYREWNVKKKKKIEDVCVSMDDFTWNLICATLCIIRWLSVQYNNKKRHFGFFIQLIRWAPLWSVLYFYGNWQLSAKKKQQHGSGREWESFFREWNGIFLQFFRGIGTGRD